jgi:hypothetical protein
MGGSLSGPFTLYTLLAKPTAFKCGYETYENYPHVAFPCLRRLAFCDSGATEEVTWHAREVTSHVSSTFDAKDTAKILTAEESA